MQAFIVFESPSEARRATHKDRETFGEKFGDRYVRVSLPHGERADRLMGGAQAARAAAYSCR